MMTKGRKWGFYHDDSKLGSLKNLNLKYFFRIFLILFCLGFLNACFENKIAEEHIGNPKINPINFSKIKDKSKMKDVIALLGTPNMYNPGLTNYEGSGRYFWYFDYTLSTKIECVFLDSVLVSKKFNQDLKQYKINKNNEGFIEINKFNYFGIQ